MRAVNEQSSVASPELDLSCRAKLYSVCLASKVHDVDNSSAVKSMRKAKVSSCKYTMVYNVQTHLGSLAAQKKSAINNGSTFPHKETTRWYNNGLERCKCKVNVITARLIW